ncbi:SUMO ligase siz1 [Peltigera leucophlebia]|nr:SUMO ligase siz1 [Peltigera leucophlebia]
MASQGPFQDTPAVIAKVKTLINAQLKSVLKKEGLLVSGVKAAMQDRIISRKFLQSNLAKDTIFVTCWTMVALMLADINQYVIRRDTGGYFRLRALIETADGSVPVSAKPPSFPHVTPSHPHQQQHPLSASGIAVSGDAFSAGALSHSVYPAPVFKESPFYSILEPLTSVLECKALVREATRDQFEVKITLKNDAAEKLSKDPSIKAMIYCASEPISPFSKVDISFPYQLEIKINGDEVKANLRGLKNKLGSTRPADITTLLRRRAGYENSMAVTYALTNREQAPTWQCPICSKSISFEALAVDQYVNDVLANTPQDMEQVTIEPDGKWSQISEPDVTPNTSSNQTVSADDDELIEIRDMPRVVSVSNGYPHLTSNSPQNISTEPPTASLIVPTGGAKRSHLIIDISSDEEGGEQRRGPKRQHQLSNACSAFTLFQNGTLSGSRNLEGS